MSCSELQTEELEVLKSIYEGDDAYSAIEDTVHQYKARMVFGERIKLTFSTHSFPRSLSLGTMAAAAPSCLSCGGLPSTPSPKVAARPFGPTDIISLPTNEFNDHTVF